MTFDFHRHSPLHARGIILRVPCTLLWLACALCSAAGCGTTTQASPPAAGRARVAPQVEAAPPALPRSTARAAPAGAAPAGRPLILWTVHQGDRLVGHLHGSVHILPGERLGRDPRIDQAFAFSDVLVVEADGKPADRSLQLLTVQLGMYPRSESLADHISEALLSQVLARVDELGLPREAALRMRPWLLAVTLTLRGLGGHGFSPEYGVDRRYLAQAQGADADKDILALETAESQLRLFSDLTEDQQVLFLRDVLMRSDEQQELRSILDAWSRGDTRALAELLFAPLRADSSLRPLYETFYFKRNRAMAARLSELFAAPRVYFVVVGAAHLVGAESVVALLQERGFTVEQVVAPAETPAGGTTGPADAGAEAPLSSARQPQPNPVSGIAPGGDRK